MPSTPGTVNYPASLDDAVSLIEVKNNASSTLTAGITSSDLVIPVADPSEFPSSGYATLVDSLSAPTKIEIFLYTSKSGSNLVVPSGGRGAQGTTAQSFSSGNFIEQRPTASHHEALRGAIIAIETKLGSGSDTSASGQVLIGNGSGSSEWRAIAASDLPTAIDAAKIADGTVSNTEFQYINGVTSAIQTQLDGKAASSHNHAASDITSGQLALARGGTGADLSATGAGYLKQSSTGANVTVGAIAAGDLPTGIDAAKIGAGGVSNTEFGYLDGVTSAIQTQLDSKAATSHSHAASDITSGTLAIARGGTATGTAPTNGQLLIGNASGGYTVATLTAGSNVTITNGNGSITIASSGGASGYATVQEEGTGLTQRATINFVGSGITASDNAGQSRTDVTLSAQLNSLADLASNGIVARTASNTITARTLTGTSNRVTITNGDGVIGNPTFDIGSDVVTLTGTQTLTNKTLTSPTIAKIANLTSNGFVKTSGGDGTLSVDTATYLTGNQTVTLSGDVSGSGATSITATIGNNAVTDAKFRQSAGLSIVGRSANTTGNVADITGTDGQVLRVSGTSLGFGTIATAGLANNAVTNAKLAQVATQTFKGRTTASTGDVEDLTATQATAILNAFTGDSGSGGVKGLVPAPATGDAAANKYLKADGTWATVSGSGGDSIQVNGSNVTDANFTSTPAAPAGGANVIWQTTGSGPASVSGYVDVGSMAIAHIREPRIFTEFLSNTLTNGTQGSEFTINAVGTGPTASGAGTVATANHPGVYLIRSGTSANSGYNYRTQAAIMTIGGGERFDIIFRTPASFTDVVYRFGFIDSTQTDCIDGAYLEHTSGGAIVGKTANNSTRTTSSTITTMATDTWYHGVVLVNSNATQVDFSIYSEAGSLLGTQSITTNIPTTSGRETGAGAMCVSAGTTAIDVVYLDYMSVSWTKALVRGQ